MQVSWLLNVAAAPTADLLGPFLIGKGTQNTKPWKSFKLPLLSGMLLVIT